MSDSTTSVQNGATTPANGRRVKWIPGIVFVLVGIGLLVATAVLTQQTQDFLARASRTEGVVVDVRYGNQHPSVGFTLPNGEKVLFFGRWLALRLSPAPARLCPV